MHGVLEDQQGDVGLPENRFQLLELLLEFCAAVSLLRPIKRDFREEEVEGESGQEENGCEDEDEALPSPIESADDYVAQQQSECIA